MQQGEFGLFQRGEWQYIQLKYVLAAQFDSEMLLEVEQWKEFEDLFAECDVCDLLAINSNLSLLYA